MFNIMKKKWGKKIKHRMVLVKEWICLAIQWIFLVVFLLSILIFVYGMLKSRFGGYESREDIIIGNISLIVIIFNGIIIFNEFKIGARIAATLISGTLVALLLLTTNVFG